MKVPEFPEAEHPIVRSRLASPDPELVQGYQRHPEQGQFFTAIFCRYGAMSYTVLQKMAPSLLQVDYLFARLWRNIFYELRNFGQETTDDEKEAEALQNWILDKTALVIHEEEPPQIETIQYSMQSASPPLWCYLHQALEQLPPLLRLILVLAQTHHWQEDRIAGFLQSEGEIIDAAEIPLKLQEAQRLLQDALPTDIRDIYFRTLEQTPLPSIQSPDPPSTQPEITGFDQPMPLRTQLRPGEDE